MTQFERINQPLAPTIKAVIVVGCLMLLAVALAVVKIEEPEGKAAPVDDGYSDYRSDAIFVCKEVVRRSAKYPSKASFPFFDIGWLQSPTDPTHVVVRGGVELMNGFGAMIPHRYRCEFKAGEMTAVNVTPG